MPVPSLPINNVSKREGKKLPQSSLGLSRFPQVVSLISCFSCTGPRSTIPLSLTRTHNNARNGCICAGRPLGNIRLPNSFNFSLCRASTIGLKGRRWGAEEAGKLAPKVARTVLTVRGLDGLKRRTVAAHCWENRVLEAIPAGLGGHPDPSLSLNLTLTISLAVNGTNYWIAWLCPPPPPPESLSLSHFSFSPDDHKQPLSLQTTRTIGFLCCGWSGDGRVNFSSDCTK